MKWTDVSISDLMVFFAKAVIASLPVILTFGGVALVIAAALNRL